MFISNNRKWFHLWWKKDLLKHQRVSKHYENDCSMIFNLKNYIKHIFDVPFQFRGSDLQQIIPLRSIYNNSQIWYNLLNWNLSLVWRITKTLTTDRLLTTDPTTAFPSADRSVYTTVFGKLLLSKVWSSLCVLQLPVLFNVLIDTLQ